MTSFYRLLTEEVERADYIPGVTTGIVKENWDDAHMGMVRVEMFLGEKGKNVTGWVPVMTGYAGTGYGCYQLPEVGAEVVIAFLCGEREHPVVLGCLWDKKNTLPEETANEKNTLKRFRTKGGCEVFFSDEENKENITIHTKGNLTACLDDEKKLIQLQDEKAENRIELNCEEGNLTIQAKKKIEIKIGDNAVVTVEENALKLNSKDITLEATGTLTANGQNVSSSAKANAEFEGKSGMTVKSSGSVSLSSSAVLEIKGNMVKIN